MGSSFHFLLASVKFGVLSRRREIGVPFSEFNMRVLSFLRLCGYVRGFWRLGKGIRVELVYSDNGVPPFLALKPVSTPGHRRYLSYRSILRCYGRCPFVLVSTSLGLRTLGELRKNRFVVGGEIVCVHGRS